jgi:hypothetical protein
MKIKDLHKYWIFNSLKKLYMILAADKPSVDFMLYSLSDAVWLSI